MFGNKPKCRSFPTAQFLMSGFCKSYRLDPCSSGGAFCFILETTYHLVYLLSISHLKMQNVYLWKLISERKNGFFVAHIIPHKNNRFNHLHHLNIGLHVYLKHHDDLLILGDLNSELKDSCLNDLSNVNNLKSLNKETTCFQNPSKPSCIDLFLTSSRYFQNKSTIETGISDFHKLIVTVLKCSIKSKSRKPFNTETIKLLKSNYLELNWTKSQQKLI